LMAMFESGGILKLCTQMSFSWITSPSRRWIVHRKKYLVTASIIQDFRRPNDIMTARTDRGSPQLDVDPRITLVLLLNVLEVEVKRLSLTHLARSRQLLCQREELVVVAPRESWSALGVYTGMIDCTAVRSVLTGHSTFLASRMTITSIKSQFRVFVVKCKQGLLTDLCSLRVLIECHRVAASCHP
jgi:hypothetical protein